MTFTIYSKYLVYMDYSHVSFTPTFPPFFPFPSCCLFVISVYSYIVIVEQWSTTSCFRSPGLLNPFSHTFQCFFCVFVLPVDYLSEKNSSLHASCCFYGGGCWQTTRYWRAKTFYCRTCLYLLICWYTICSSSFLACIFFILLVN